MPSRVTQTLDSPKIRRSRNQESGERMIKNLFLVLVAAAFAGACAPTDEPHPPITTLFLLLCAPACAAAGAPTEDPNPAPKPEPLPAPAPKPEPKPAPPPPP